MATATVSKSAAKSKASANGTNPAETKTVMVKATAEMIVSYCAAIVAGIPPTGIFGTKMTNVAFTDAQRDQIRAARKQHRAESKAAKRAWLAKASKKENSMIGHRENLRGTKFVLRFENEQAEAVAKAKGKKIKAVKAPAPAAPAAPVAPAVVTE